MSPSSVTLIEILLLDRLARIAAFSESKLALVTTSLDGKFAFDASVSDNDNQMDSSIHQDNYYVEVTNTVSSLGIGDVVCEKHLSISED